PPELGREHLEERLTRHGLCRPLIGWLRDVERVLVTAVVEDRVDGRATHLIHLGEMSGLVCHRDQRSRPDTDLRVPAEKSIRNLQGYAEHVQVGKEVGSRELQSIQEPE